MKTNKSWREKLGDNKDLPKTFVVPAPKEVDEAMRQVPRGRITTIKDLRACLARKHGTTTACPMVTGIFAWIAAHAADEAAAEGESNTTPYWRTLKAEGEINAKYPGGIPRQKKLLEAEGHKIVRKGKGYFVANHERYLSHGDIAVPRVRRESFQPAPVL